MIYNIEFSPRAEKDYKNLDFDIITKKRIARVIENLKINPITTNSKKLKNSDYWRIRVGDYRIIYYIENDKLIILIIKIGHRREIYKKI